MHTPPRPTLTSLTRVVALGIVLAFALSAISIAYAAGRHSAQDGRHALGAHAVVRAVDRGALVGPRLSSEAVG